MPWEWTHPCLGILSHWSWQVLCCQWLFSILRSWRWRVLDCWWLLLLSLTESTLTQPGHRFLLLINCVLLTCAPLFGFAHFPKEEFNCVRCHLIWQQTTLIGNISVRISIQEIIKESKKWSHKNTFIKLHWQVVSVMRAVIRHSRFYAYSSKTHSNTQTHSHAHKPKKQSTEKEKKQPTICSLQAATAFSYKDGQDRLHTDSVPTFSVWLTICQ